MSIPHVTMSSAHARGSSRQWGIGFLLALCLTPALCQADERTASISATIARAWNDRESRVKTLDCEWSAEMTEGAKTWVYPADQNGDRFFLPENDLTTSHEYRFRLQGHRKMRYEYTGLVPNQWTRSYVDRDYVSVTDGIEQKCYYGKDKAPGEPRYAPLGFINEEVILPETGTIHLWPLLMLYRPSARDVAAKLDLSKYVFKGPIAVAGKDCLLWESGGGGEKLELVIDAKRGCAPVRFRRLRRDGSMADSKWYASTLVEINYIDQADGSWRLGGWKSAILKPEGKVIEQMTAVVKRLEINVDVPDPVFRFDFPAGTDVTNWNTKERYILREGGGKRYITQAEADARVPYKRLLVTETGQGFEPKHGGWSWLVLSVPVVLGLLLVLWVVRRRMKSHNPTGAG